MPTELKIDECSDGKGSLIIMIGFENLKNGRNFNEPV